MNRAVQPRPNELLGAAARFAGVPVFPSVPGGKNPLTQHGFKDATTNETAIRRWWSRWPNANVAIATGSPGFDVLDVAVDVQASARGETPEVTIGRRLLVPRHQLTRMLRGDTPANNLKQDGTRKMRSTAFVTTRTGGGKQVHARKHTSLEAALADAERARVAGRDVRVVRHDVRDSVLARGLASAPGGVLRASDLLRRGVSARATSRHPRTSAHASAQEGS
jgi:hypothetical protein